MSSFSEDYNMMVMGEDLKLHPYQREMIASWSMNYDTPIYTVEKDNKKIMLYELIGVSEDMLKIGTEFVNKTKTTYLNITGEFEDKLTGWKNDINIHERIDTNIYSSYACNIRDGILTVILGEILNDRPKFDSSYSLSLNFNKGKNI